MLLAQAVVYNSFFFLFISRINLLLHNTVQRFCNHRDYTGHDRCTGRCRR